MKRLFTNLLAMLLLGLLGIGCIEDFDPPSLVTKTRPLGARVEVEGAPERAWPAPGEMAEVRWLFVGPEEPEPRTWGFVACPAIVAPTGDRFCGGEPFGVELQTEPVTDDPVVALEVPEAEALADFEAVLVLGVVCIDGIVDFDAEAMDVRCEGGRPQAVQLTIPLALDGGNENPEIPEEALTFDGEIWLAPPEGLSQEGCADEAGTPELPRVEAGTGELDMVIDAAGIERESFDTAEGTRTEDLRIQHVTTAGELDRIFSIIDADESMARVEWTPPGEAEVAANGTVVRFHVVITDERAGTDWVSRAACVVP